MIAVRNLKKSYGELEALKGITFTINKGDFYGLLGPNGAGKTTTISILSTVMSPLSGSIEIDGMNPENQAFACKKALGIVTQEISLYENLTGYENMMFWGSLYKINKATLKSRTHNLLQMIGLSERQHDKVSTYSGGMKRRINIASSLLHDPKVLLLDEPTVGIDPQSRNLIFEVLENLHQQGMTIIYTTHYMEEAERLCNRIAIIDKGLIIAEGTLDELKSNCPIKETIVIESNPLSEDIISNLMEEWQSLKNIGDSIIVSTNNARDDLHKIIKRCDELKIDIKHIDICKVSLETIFLNLTGKQLRD